MPTDPDLIPALRQYRHNNRDSFVVGYDRDTVDLLVVNLRNRIRELEECSQSTQPEESF